MPLSLHRIKHTLALSHGMSQPFDWSLQNKVGENPHSIHLLNIPCKLRPWYFLKPLTSLPYHL